MTASVKSSAKSKKTGAGARRHTTAENAAPFDRRKYAALLSRALPVVIATEAEYDQTISEINRLLRKGEANLSLEEDRLLDLLSTLAENWEEDHHPIFYMTSWNDQNNGMTGFFGSISAVSDNMHSKVGSTNHAQLQSRSNPV